MSQICHAFTLRGENVGSLQTSPKGALLTYYVTSRKESGEMCPNYVRDPQCPPQKRAGHPPLSAVKLPNCHQQSLWL